MKKINEGKQIQLLYIEETNITREKYLEFLKCQYGDRALQKCTQRVYWYKSKGEFKILLAVEGEYIIGQSCAFKDIAIINDKETEIWWGIDVFVLREAQGRGIGKLMQKKLHNDLPNFCSVWYSPLNGIVKRKCGSKELFPVSFSYYPVSSFFSYLTFLVIKKLFKKTFLFKISIPYVYSFFNKRRKLSSYTFNEIELNKDDVYEFIRQSTNKKFDFYIKRDKKYLKWRYLDNPNLKYHIIEILFKEKREAILIFTQAYKQDGFYITKFMDLFKVDESNLTIKDCHVLIAEYYKYNKKYLDGIQSLFEVNYYPKVVRHSFFLSNMRLEYSVRLPYISYSDQDMVQMY